MNTKLYSIVMAALCVALAHLYRDVSRLRDDLKLEREQTSRNAAAFDNYLTAKLLVEQPTWFVTGRQSVSDHAPTMGGFLPYRTVFVNLNDTSLFPTWHHRMGPWRGSTNASYDQEGVLRSFGRAVRFKWADRPDPSRVVGGLVVAVPLDPVN